MRTSLRFYGRECERRSTGSRSYKYGEVSNNDKKSRTDSSSLTRNLSSDTVKSYSSRYPSQGGRHTMKTVRGLVIALFLIRASGLFAGPGPTPPPVPRPGPTALPEPSAVPELV